MRHNLTVRQRIEEHGLDEDLEGKKLDVDESFHELLDRHEALMMECDDLRRRLHAAKQALEGNF